jgi:membrane dipeptidase
MLSFVPYFTTQSFADWFKKGEDYWGVIESKHKGQRDLMAKDMDQWEKDNPIPAISIPDVADHFDYVKQLIGVDYIGIGSDFDGIDYLVNGLEDVSTFPALLTELARRGWSEMDLRKISGENFLRVLEAVENKAGEIQKTIEPSLATLGTK